MMCGKGHACDDCDCPEEQATDDLNWQTYLFVGLLVLVIGIGCLWP